MSDLPNEFASSFMDDYFAESEEHLTSVRRTLLALESSIGGDVPPAIVEELFRRFHSLKGISAMVEVKEAERLAHEMESCLGLMRDRRLVLDAALFERLVVATTALESVVAARRAGDPTPPVDELVAQLRSACATTAQPGGSATTPERVGAAADGGTARWAVTFTPSPALVARGIKVDTIRDRLAETGRIVHVTPRVTTDGGIAFDFDVIGADDASLGALQDSGVTYQRVETSVEESAGSLPHPSTRVVGTTPPGATNFVRVDLSRLDDLMRLVGDLVVSRARLAEALRAIEALVPPAALRSLQEEAATVERQVRDLRDGVMRVRLVPVAEIFRRMPFVVRDLARDDGKRVQLDVAGHGTEIDKFLIERMMDPVLHLVRNAVSHGIEPPDVRVAAGKRPEGTIRLSASTVGEVVVLDVHDDGRGIDVAAIAQRARAMGLHVGDDLDAPALLELICSPGFSTRHEADRASGRGVGMSVVRDTVQELGGTLTVETAAGAGTTFRITLPLTLAIADALIVQVGDRTFAVLQSAVHEVAEIEAQWIRTIENNELTTHRGHPLPVVRLSRLFAVDVPPRSRMHMMVIGTGPAGVGLLVDRIAGQREIVVKTLRDPLVNVTGISGATQLGDGRLVLILDVAGLTRRLRGRTPAFRAAV